MKRTNLYLTEKQVERLKQRSEREGLSLAELVRRAVDAYLAWDDPLYAPNPSRPARKGHSSPLSRDGAFWPEFGNSSSSNISRRGDSVIFVGNG